jgi:hypothetical protein
MALTQGISFHAQAESLQNTGLCISNQVCVDCEYGQWTKVGLRRRKRQKVRLWRRKFAKEFRVASDVSSHAGCIVYIWMRVSLSELANCLSHEVIQYGT